MDFEKALKKYLNGTGQKIEFKKFAKLVWSNGDDAIKVLFQLVNQELDTMNDEKNLDRVVEVLKYVGVVISNSDNINRKLIIKKLAKLDEKIDRIEIEGQSKFNQRHLFNELEKVRRKCLDLEKMAESKNPKQYDLMKYLIDEMKQIEYIEFSVEYMPSLVNVRDKDENHIIINLIKKYIENIENFNEENLYYYRNLIIYITSQNNFKINDCEYRICLNEINKCINKLSYVKKKAKKNKDKLLYLQELVNIIKTIGDDKKNVQDIAKKYNIQVYFDDDIIEKSKLVHAPKEGVMQDRKILDDYIISIDKASTVQIDDGLSCRKLSNGNYLLGVHIASVLGYFPYNSDIVNEALNRDRTIYLSNSYHDKDGNISKVISILPRDFSTNTGSLIENEPRLARTYYFELDNKGNVVDEHFIKSIITNKKQMSYKEVNDILENGTNDEKLAETINNLQEVTKLLDSKTKVSKLYSDIKENTTDPSDLRVKKYGSENIVYQSMLLTGTRVAKYFYDHNYPCLYRVHEINEENMQKIQELIDNLTKTYGGKIYKPLLNLVQGVYPKGWYDLSGSHYGLGVEHYCHCTSALRRSADIVVEHALEVCHDTTPTSADLETLKNEIEYRAKEINAKEKNIDWFVKEYQKIYHR